jgi:3-isopropylmalate/(R)-2-methylmalate dehydratase small subunit
VDKFAKLTGVAAPLAAPNVNTDVLVRIERLADCGKGQLGAFAFETWRYDSTGAENPNFVLNQARYRGSTILLAGRNFGCGSSREGAVWALWDFGIRCIIAPSFGDIFHTNCFQNGLLAIVLPQASLDALMEAAAAPDASLCTVDLVTQTITTPLGRQLSFPVDAPKRLALLEGLDEISMTLGKATEIADFQRRDRQQRPWIYEFQ